MRLGLLIGFVFSLLAMLAPGRVLAAPPTNGQCFNAPPNYVCIDNITADYETNNPGGGENRIRLRVHWFVPGQNVQYDKYNLILSETFSNNSAVSPDPQQEIDGGSNTVWVSAWLPYVPGVEGPPYWIQVQGCTNAALSTANCQDWTIAANYTPPPPETCTPPPGSGWIVTCPPPTPPTTASPSGGINVPPGGYHLPPAQGVEVEHPGVHLSSTPSPGSQLNPARAEAGAAAPVPTACKPGFVYRQAFAADQVCVSPAAHAEALAENQTADALRQPGSEACLSGYVWRQANASDHVCVTPLAHDQVLQDDEQAASRVAH
ncbi:MAG TPA: hypothetical protein VN805_04795 [Caulobacteraceae bacterium]|nr:hypothetical protein [Caulobacteraceae bacterium]